MENGLMICIVENEFWIDLLKEHVNKHNGFREEINQAVQEGSKVKT